MASGGLNLSSTDNGCAQSAGNGCDLMQQQENKGTCPLFHENPCSVNETRQDVAIFGRTIFWLSTSSLSFPNDRHLHQALADARVADDLEGIPDEWKKHDRDCSNGKKHPPNLFGKESTSYANPFAPLKTNMDTKLFHAWKRISPPNHHI